MCMCSVSGKVVPEMTYTVLGVTLNPTHSLTHLGYICVCMYVLLS